MTEIDADLQTIIHCPEHGTWLPQPARSYGCLRCRDEVRAAFYLQISGLTEAEAHRKASLYLHTGCCYG